MRNFTDISKAYLNVLLDCVSFSQNVVIPSLLTEVGGLDYVPVDFKWCMLGYLEPKLA